MQGNEIASYIQTIVILVTGLSAFIIYLFNKHNEMRSAARIIFLEIKKAETTIYLIKNNGFATDETLILSNASWDSYRHLFIKKLNPEEFSCLEDFYTTCKQTQSILNETKKYHETGYYQRAIKLQEALLHLAERDSIDATDYYEDRKTGLLKRVHQEDYWYIPNSAKEKLNKYLQSYKPIIGTTTFVKIRKIAKM